MNTTVPAWLPYMREWANDPRAWVWILRGKVILPEDVSSRPDDAQLIEFLRDRIAE